MQQRGKWVEEMVNESDKSLISDVKWSNTGFNLCIIIDDGQIIVGSVEGERIWYKKLTNKAPYKVTW